MQLSCIIQIPGKTARLIVKTFRISTFLLLTNNIQVSQTEERKTANPPLLDPSPKNWHKSILALVMLTH